MGKDLNHGGVGDEGGQTATNVGSFYKTAWNEERAEPRGLVHYAIKRLQAVHWAMQVVEPLCSSGHKHTQDVQ